MKSLIHRLIRIDHLITYKRTGRPSECAKKIGISERSLFDYLKLLREMGAPISFSRTACTYYYEKYGSFKITFIKQSEMDDDLSLASENEPEHSLTL